MVNDGAKLSEDGKSVTVTREQARAAIEAKAAAQGKKPTAEAERALARGQEARS